MKIGELEMGITFRKCSECKKGRNEELVIENIRSEIKALKERNEQLLVDYDKLSMINAKNLTNLIIAKQTILDYRIPDSRLSTLQFVAPDSKFTAKEIEREFTVKAQNKIMELNLRIDNLKAENKELKDTMAGNEVPLVNSLKLSLADTRVLNQRLNTQNMKQIDRINRLVTEITTEREISAKLKADIIQERKDRIGY